jgi:hypothetical protein
MKVAFRKGRDGLMGLLIRLRTLSAYSHCELVLEGGLGQESQCFSASWLDGGVRLKTITLDPGRWDIVEVAAGPDQHSFLERALREATKPYDTWGALMWGTAFARAEAKKRWFCSEICAYALGLAEPWRYSPGGLHRHLAAGRGQGRTAVTFLLPQATAGALIAAARAAGRLQEPATIIQDHAVLAGAEAFERLFEAPSKAVQESFEDGATDHE